MEDMAKPARLAGSGEPIGWTLWKWGCTSSKAPKPAQHQHERLAQVVLTLAFSELLVAHVYNEPQGKTSQCFDEAFTSTLISLILSGGSGRLVAKHLEG